MLAAVTDRGLVRATNQDVALVRALPDGSALLAVADGVGGYPGGEVASALAIDAVARSLEAAPPGAAPAPMLTEAFRAADRRVRAEQHDAHAHMCTTLVVALVRGDEAWVANVGDSRAYLFAAGALTPVTTDHSWVAEEIRAGRLRDDDPRAPALRHLVTRVIGGEAGGDADVFGPLALARDAALLLCSDGLHGYVPDGAIAAALTPPDAGTAARLIALALERGGIDNVAVALWAAGRTGRAEVDAPGA